MKTTLTVILFTYFGIGISMAQTSDSVLIEKLSELSYKQISAAEDSLQIELNKNIAVEFIKHYKENGGNPPLFYYGYDNALPLNDKYPDLCLIWSDKEQAYQNMKDFRRENDSIFNDAHRKFKAHEIPVDQYNEALAHNTRYLWKNYPEAFRNIISLHQTQVIAYNCAVILKLIAESTAKGKPFDIDWIPSETVNELVKTESVKSIHHQLTLLSKAYVVKCIKNEITINIERTNHSKEIAFELRLHTMGGFFSANDLIRIIKDNNGIWSVQEGQLGDKRDGEENEFTYEPLPQHDSIDWNMFEAKLNHFLSLRLKTQTDLKLRYQETNKKYDEKPSDYFNGKRFIDAHTFVIEMYNNRTYRQISYLMPATFIKELKNDGLNSIEHEEFLKFTNYILDVFSAGYLI